MQSPWRWDKVKEIGLGFVLTVLAILQWPPTIRLILAGCAWLVLMHILLTLHDGIAKNERLESTLSVLLSIVGAFVLFGVYQMLFPPSPNTTAMVISSPTPIEFKHRFQIQYSQKSLAPTLYVPPENKGGTTIWKFQAACVALTPKLKHQWPAYWTPNLDSYSNALIRLDPPGVFPDMKVPFGKFTCVELASRRTPGVDDLYFVMEDSTTINATADIFQEAEFVRGAKGWQRTIDQVINPSAHTCCYEILKEFLLQHPYPYSTPEIYTPTPNPTTT